MYWKLWDMFKSWNKNLALLDQFRASRDNCHEHYAKTRHKFAYFFYYEANNSQQYLQFKCNIEDDMNFDVTISKIK